MCASMTCLSTGSFVLLEIVGCAWMTSYSSLQEPYTSCQEGPCCICPLKVLVYPEEAEERGQGKSQDQICRVGI